MGPPGTEPLAGSGPVGWASAVSRPLGPVSGALGSDPITGIDCHLQVDTIEFILVIFTAVLKHRYDFLRVLLEEIGFQKATCLASSGSGHPGVLAGLAPPATAAGQAQDLRPAGGSDKSLHVQAPYTHSTHTIPHTHHTQFSSVQ